MVNNFPLSLFSMIMASLPLAFFFEWPNDSTKEKWIISKKKKESGEFTDYLL